MATCETATIGTVTYVGEENRRGFRLQVFAVIRGGQPDAPATGGVIACFTDRAKGPARSKHSPRAWWHRQQAEAA